MAVTDKTTSSSESSSQVTSEATSTVVYSSTSASPSALGSITSPEPSPTTTVTNFPSGSGTSIPYPLSSSSASRNATTPTAGCSPGSTLDPAIQGNCTSSDNTSLPAGAIAGISIGSIGVVALAIVGIYLLYRRKRRYMLHEGEEEESGPGAIAMESRRHDRGAANPNSNPAPVVKFDDPLDDVGVKKLFDQLDDRISDHLVNFGLQESQKYPGFTEEIDASIENILFRGQALLGRQDSRLYMLRALFAYHIFGSIADPVIFTKEQSNWIRQAPRAERSSRRATICRGLENREQFADAVKFLHGHLDRQTHIHIPENILKSENYQASLGAIARNTANVIIRLGLQPGSFKLGFLFQTSNLSQVEGVIPCEASAIGEFRASPEDYQIFGEAGHDGVASAMLSPSVYRRPDGENHKYKVRNMKIFMAPRTLK